MNSLIFNTKQLQKAVDLASTITNSKALSDSIPFQYSAFNITAGNKKVYLKSLNANCKITQTIELETEPDKNKLILVDPFRLKQALVNANSEKTRLDIISNGSQLEVATDVGLYKFSIPRVEGTDSIRPFLFEERSTKKTEFVLDAHDFTQHLSQLANSAGTPNNTYQPEFLCVQFRFNEDKTLTLSSSDRYRVYSAELALQHNSLEDLPDEDILVHAQLLNKLASIYKSELPESIKVENDVDEVYFYLNSVAVCFNKSVGNYPDIKKIIPKEIVYKMKFNKSDLLKAFKAVGFLSNENTINKAVDLHFNFQGHTSGKLEIKSKAKDDSSAEAIVDMLEVDGSTVSFSQSFNVDFLTTYLSKINSEVVIWQANPGRPSVLMHEKGHNLYLVSGLK